MAKPKARCSVCHKLRAINADGRIRFHRWRRKLGVKQTCRGAAQHPDLPLTADAVARAEA